MEFLGKVGCVDKREQTENALKDYFSGRLQNNIVNRRLQAKYPRKLGGENPTKVQTSTKGESPQEGYIERLEADRDLIMLERKHKIIENYLDYLKDIEEGLGFKILYQYYYQKKTWQQVESSLSYTKNSCIKRRNNMLDELTERLASLE